LCAEKDIRSTFSWQVDGDLAGRLHRIDVEHDAAFGAQLAQLGDGLDHADLVVDIHHRGQQRVRPQSRTELGQRDEAVAPGCR
jgi:hypothetical protein